MVLNFFYHGIVTAQRVGLCIMKNVSDMAFKFCSMRTVSRIKFNFVYDKCISHSTEWCIMRNMPRMLLNLYYNKCMGQRVEFCIMRNASRVVLNSHYGKLLDRDFTSVLGEICHAWRWFLVMANIWGRALSFVLLWIYHAWWWNLIMTNTSGRVMNYIFYGICITLSNDFCIMKNVVCVTLNFVLRKLYYAWLWMLYFENCIIRDIAFFFYEICITLSNGFCRNRNVSHLAMNSIAWEIYHTEQYILENKKCSRLAMDCLEWEAYHD